MKIMTILGTRPEIIRLSLVIKKLDKYCEHVLVHTGQNYDDKLSQLFFDELKIREPDHYLGIKTTSFGEQIGLILTGVQNLVEKEKPDRVLILGDTNSGLSAIVAKRLGIPVFHMEAGNRCFDERVPEEVNRKLIDHSSTILMPYTQNSKQNLLQEGIPQSRIFVTGNPIYEVLEHYKEEIKASQVLNTLNMTPGKYFLVTVHRAENVDYKESLQSIIAGLDSIATEYNMPVICSLHPRTRSKIQQFNLKINSEHLRFMEPFGLFDFIALEKHALCVITDSGTVQEECCIFNIPNITIRQTTERPETIEAGSNILAGISPEMLLKATRIVLGEKQKWQPPADYIDATVSSKVLKIVLGYHQICDQ